MECELYRMLPSLEQRASSLVFLFKLVFHFD